LSIHHTTPGRPPTQPARRRAFNRPWRHKGWCNPRITGPSGKSRARIVDVVRRTHHGRTVQRSGLYPRSSLNQRARTHRAHPGVVVEICTARRSPNNSSHQRSVILTAAAARSTPGNRLLTGYVARARPGASAGPAESFRRPALGGVVAHQGDGMSRGAAGCAPGRRRFHKHQLWEKFSSKFARRHRGGL
jgi:hypothetical protein